MFNGFSQEALDFLMGIRLNNSKEWFEPRKEIYTSSIQTPLKELGEELFAPFAETEDMMYKVGRIYRDANFPPYLHYRDVYDLLSQIESEVLKQFSELLDQHASLSLSDDPRPLLCDLFQLIRDNADLTRCLIGPNGDIQFLNRLRAIFNEKVITPSLRELNLKDTVDYSYWYAFISEGFLGIIKLWLEDDAAVPPEEMADRCVSMIRAGFRAFMAPEERE